MSKYYFHGVKQLLNFYAVEQILISGGIKSKNLQHRSYKIGFNGNDYVSVCKKTYYGTDSKNDNLSFDLYVKNRFCFILSEDIPAIKTVFISNLLDWDRFKLIRFMNEHPDIRISDMPDEYQVRDEIPLNQVVAIGVPVKELFDLMSSKLDLLDLESLKRILNIILSTAESFGLTVVDSSEALFVEKYETSSNNRSCDTVLKLLNQINS